MKCFSYWAVSTDEAEEELEFRSRSARVLADVRAHSKQPVNGLLQEVHVVVGRDVLKHCDLLREAL